MRSKAAAALALILGAPATAQDMGWSTIIPSVAGTDTLGLALRRNMNDQRPIPTRQAPAPTSRRHITTQQATPASLTYQPSLERRRANRTAFIAKTRQRSPQAAAEIDAALGQSDMIAQLDRIITPMGLRVTNVADAFAVYWIVSWQATQGHNRDVPPATSVAVRNQVARTITDANVMAGATDAAKQEFAETLLTQAMLTESAINGAKGDPKMLAIVAKAARLNAGAMGIDLDAMHLTPQGFVPS